jgi:phosphohistidine phosphatase
MENEGTTRPSGHYVQSGVVPWRRRADRLEVLLVTSRRRRRWIVPKGIVEDARGPVASAAAEAWEEAGVEGLVEDVPLGTYRFPKWGGTVTVEVFPMAVTHVHDAWPEDDRERRWFGIEDAVAHASPPALAALIALLPEHLA